MTRFLAISIVSILLPKRYLQKFLSREFLAHYLQIKGIFCFSARRGLFHIFKAFAPQSVVMYQKYICNVVPAAIKKAGCVPVSYAMTSDFCHELESLLELIKKTSPKAVILSPIYGAKCDFEWWFSQEGLRFRKSQELTLVLDMCQMDISVLDSVGTLGEKICIVRSYNDKVTPGLMGAMLWTDLPLMLNSIPKTNVNRRLFLFAIKKYLRLFFVACGKLKRANISQFEYSQCIDFPYEIEGPILGTKLQMSFAFAGLVLKSHWIARRRAFLESNQEILVALPNAERSPFVIGKPGASSNFNFKLPYAIDESPNISILPNLKVIDNRGFNF